MQSLGIDIRVFWRSGHWARFDSFLERFQIDSRSFLRWAEDNDVDRYELAEKAGSLKKGSGRIETFEWSQEATLLNRLVVEISHLSHITAVKGTRNARKKFKAPKIAWPHTAVEGLKERYRAAASEASKAFQAMFVQVPQDEWEAEMREHQEALEVGLPSPVKERALAEARAAERNGDGTRDPSSSEHVERGGLGVSSARLDG